jgi:hypothetical protein
MFVRKTARGMISIDIIAVAADSKLPTASNEEKRERATLELTYNNPNSHAHAHYDNKRAIERSLVFLINAINIDKQ